MDTIWSIGQLLYDGTMSAELLRANAPSVWVLQVTPHEPIVSSADCHLDTCALVLAESGPDTTAQMTWPWRGMPS